MESLFQTLGLKVDWRFTFTFSGLILARLVMIGTMIPFLVGKPVPPTIKMGFNVVMLIFLYPALAPTDPSLLPQGAVDLFLLFLKEAFYGIAIGVGASIVFHAFEAAGSMIDAQRGASIARLFMPQTGQQASIFGVFNNLLGIVIFLSLGGHLLFLKVMMESYETLPILEFPRQFPDMLAVAEQFIRMTGEVLLISLQLTAPILISIFVADVILGIMSKTAPAINVWELGFGIRGILGVLIYFIALGLIATQMGKMSMGMIDQVERIIRFFALSGG